jgi:uncharacterized phage protein (TIGR01671 family)
MSREIKFRAWVKMYDDSDGVMLNMPMNIHHFDFEDGIVISFTDYPEFYGHENYDHRKPKLPHEINIMQYTGFVDINGKEIYEGDIVHISGIGNYVVEDICQDFDMLVNAKVEGDLNEIVGNIYEHKELITEVKNV